MPHPFILLALPEQTDKRDLGSPVFRFGSVLSKLHSKRKHPQVHSIPTVNFGGAVYNYTLFSEMQRYANAEGDTALREKIRFDKELILWIGITP